MSEIFLYIVNMSITAGILAVVVLLLRLFLKKAPKWVSVLLWGLVALRLICPFAVESPFSLMPKTEWITEEPSVSDEQMYFDSVAIDRIPTDSPIDYGTDNDVTYYDSPLDNPNIEVHRGVSTTFILSWVWVLGMAVLLLHSVISTVRLRRSIGAAIWVRDNVWESSAVESPFVLGIFCPRIYVPRGLSDDKLWYIIAHERAHIQRRDHWWKPIGFLLLTVHWFNPVMWLAYILLCRDIEMACDERVVKGYNDIQRADYSEALLECSVKRSGKHRTMISACPLAFGEVGVKTRIQSVLNYKKPAFWVVVLAVIACIVAAVCFLTNPAETADDTADAPLKDAESYLYMAESMIDRFTLHLYPDGTFSYDNAASSTIYRGTWERVEDRIILTEDRGEEESAVKQFQVEGETLIFLAEYSSKFHFVHVPDGAKLYHIHESTELLPSDYDPNQLEILKKLTLDDVIALSAKGTDLTWEDFAGYLFTETGSGLYIRVYEIDETFSLWIGGGAPIGKPMYIRLKCMDVDIYADVTTDDIAAFIEKHSKEGPILYGRPLSYYIDLAWQEAEPIAGAKGYDVLKSDMTLTHSNDGSIFVRFNGSDCNGGWSVIHVTLVTQSEGGYGVDSSLTTATSHSELLEAEEFEAAVVKAQVQSKILNLFIVIESSPAYSSNPQDYIHAHPDEFNELVSYGYETLEFIFHEFLAGGKTRLHGHIMCTVMMNLLRDNEIIEYDAVTGQEYFDEWLKYARSVGQQHDVPWLEENVPAIALVLKMANG